MRLPWAFLAGAPALIVGFLAYNRPVGQRGESKSEGGH